MALFIQQNGNRSKLQEKLAAELQDKMKKRAQIDKELPDGVTDSAYLKDTKKTTSLAWVWILIIAFTLGAIGYFMYVSSI